MLWPGGMKKFAYFNRSMNDKASDKKKKKLLEHK